MTANRMTTRQLARFQKALQEAAKQAETIPTMEELQARRDAHLASLHS